MKSRASLSNQPTSSLVSRAQKTLGMSHRVFGQELGASERTAARWAAGHSALTVAQLSTLARLVHPHDPELASSLAASAGETLESLGIVAPAPAPALTLPPHVVADLIACAAADVLGSAPSAVRGALLAAFARARELGLSVADVEQALSAREPKGAKPPPAAG
jgi:hypothetical protein